MMDIELHKVQSQQEVANKSTRAVSNSWKSVNFDLSLHKIKGKISKRSTRAVSKSTGSVSDFDSSLQKIKGKKSKQNPLAFQGIESNTELAYKNQGEIKLRGFKNGRGIFLDKCNPEMSPSRFEACAGFGSRRKPYENIFLKSGLSLCEYASSLNSNWAKKNNDTCGTCGVFKEGEKLLFCNGCPLSYHEECITEAVIPFEKWFCKYCRNSKKCLRRNGQLACALCRLNNFSEVGFNDSTVIFCDQCEKEYHIGCLRENNIADLKDLRRDNWFCSEDCRTLNAYLYGLAKCGPQKVPQYYHDIIKKKILESTEDNTLNLDVNWKILRGRAASEEDKAQLKEAVDIFHDLFKPIIDPVTRSDFIDSMAYGKEMGGSTMNGSDFSGVYCALLTINSKVVTAGLFRVFGRNIAELSIVATSKSYQKKGCFNAFFNCFETLLLYLKIQKLLILASEEAKIMWTQKYGFCDVTQNKLNEYRQTYTSMVEFRGTSLLEKEVFKNEITFEDPQL